MKCYVHPESETVGACTRCGRGICSECAVEVQGKLVCRPCLATGATASSDKDANTAFLLELVGGIFGVLGLGYLYVGRTNDGVLRLVLWLLYNVIAYVSIVALAAAYVGCLCLPVQLAIQIGVPIWSASQLKKELLGGVPQ